MEPINEIAARIRELREVCDYSVKSLLQSSASAQSSMKATKRTAISRSASFMKSQTSSMLILMS